VDICYFSGTGNSLAVARDLAENLPAQMHAIPGRMSQDSLRSPGEALGLVFPVYHGGLPYLVKRFIDQLPDLASKYVFGVCTYGDSPGLTMEYLGKAIRARGGQLAAGYGVHMPYNYITPGTGLKAFFQSFRLREIAVERQQELFAGWKTKAGRICDAVRAQATVTSEIDHPRLNHLLDFLNVKETVGKPVWLKIASSRAPAGLPFVESRQWMDGAFWSDERCNGCGTCARLCPVGNIRMVADKPTWHQHCEQCFACLQWCPQAALQFGQKTAGQKRYHHPDVKLVDLLRRDG
jgi:ferredoxin/flavodoxin